MRVYTIGYGGRGPREVQDLLTAHGVKTLVDIRLRPDRSSMGCWTRAKTPEKGIERILSEVGVGYRSLIELGNPFVGREDWPERYGRLIAAAGDLLVEGLDGIPEPYCLMCAEKRASECHRSHVADFLRRTRDYEIVHIE